MEFPDGFPVPPGKFPVRLRREFGFPKLGNAGQDCIPEDWYRAADQAHFSHFPCYFPCCREFSGDELVLKILAQPTKSQTVRSGFSAN
jgi:hypothetical protein